MPRFVLVLILTLPSLLTFACGSKSTDKPQLASSASGPAANVPCQDGFERKGQGCVDIDECGGVATPCGPHPEAKCKNTAGAYECTCPAGYVGGGPGGFGCAPSVVAAYPHICSLSNAGDVKCWNAPRDQPVREETPAPLATLHQIAALSLPERGSGCALLRDGSVHCWGKNAYGQIGDGTTEARTAPTAVPGVRDAIAIATSRVRNCAVLRSGKVSCWGSNEYGALGRGTMGGKGAPGAVEGLNDIVSLGYDSFRSCALRRTGRVACWGFEPFGVPRPESAALPMELPNVERAVQVSVGSTNHSCFLRNDRTVWCWGRNIYGEVGNGNQEIVEKPLIVPSLRDVTLIGAAPDESCALVDGSLFRWGRDHAEHPGQDSEGYDSMKEEATTKPTLVRGLEPITVVAERPVYFGFEDGSAGFVTDRLVRKVPPLPH